MIMLIVQIAKSKGLKGDNAMILSIVMGIAFGILSELEQPSELPPIARWIGASIKGFLTGAAASGAYAMIKSTQNTADKAELKEKAVQDQTKTEINTTATPEGVKTEIEIESVIGAPTEEIPAIGGSPPRNRF